MSEKNLHLDFWKNKSKDNLEFKIFYTDSGSKYYLQKLGLG